MTPMCSSSVGLAGVVAAAGLDLDLSLERTLVIQGADDLVGIDDLDVRVGLMSAV
jgi:hypothetical protein